MIIYLHVVTFRIIFNLLKFSILDLFLYGSSMYNMFLNNLNGSSIHIFFHLFDITISKVIYIDKKLY